jgi:hypothetical protein
MLAVIVASLSLAIGSVALQTEAALKDIVGSYLQIHAQLAADKTDGVKSIASALATKAENLGSQGTAVAKAAKALGDASDLKTMRDAFGPLSDAVIAMAPPETMKSLGVKKAFCPMVNRSWLQKDDKLKNPYYGSLMLECGEFKK